MCIRDRDKNKGPVASLLVTNGTLKSGMSIVAGDVYKRQLKGREAIIEKMDLINAKGLEATAKENNCLLYTSPSQPRGKTTASTLI